MPVLHLKDNRTTTPRDPLGFRYPWVHRVLDDTGIGTPVTGRQAMGVTVDTGRLLIPGDRVVFHCEGSDPHGRELRWWVHPYGVDPTPVVRGDRVDLTWIVEPVSNGPRVYVGIGMAADSRHHRQGGLNDQGYDGWVVFYYRVAPASCRIGERP
jgi:hypothetical protein